MKRYLCLLNDLIIVFAKYYDDCLLFLICNEYISLCICMFLEYIMIVFMLFFYFFKCIFK
jgi:hypothetical protein